MLAAKRGATLRVILVDDSGQTLLDECENPLSTARSSSPISPQPCLNALGKLLPRNRVVQMAHFNDRAFGLDFTGALPWCQNNFCCKRGTA
jgi:hypothetical protein